MSYAIVQMDKTVWHMSPGGVLRISSDRDDQRIFWGIEIFDFGIFLGRKILASNFWGSLI